MDKRAELKEPDRDGGLAVASASAVVVAPAQLLGGAFNEFRWVGAVVDAPEGFPGLVDDWPGGVTQAARPYFARSSRRYCVFVLEKSDGRTERMMRLVKARRRR